MMTPLRRPNDAIRSREYLTTAEVKRLQQAAIKRGRHGHRDSTLILIGFRHGFRAGELVALKWEQVDLSAGMLHVRRSKRGTPSTHPLSRVELAALKKLPRHPSGFVFVSERGAPLSTSAFAKIVERAGDDAEIGMPIHPHMLRHACGYFLANQGHDTRAIQAYLGHKNIQHTVKYTELAPHRFKDFFPD